VFALFGRRRSAPPLRSSEIAPPLRSSETAPLSLSDEMSPPSRRPEDLEGQAALICQTLRQLETVQRIVHDLPELPVGDRQTLLDQLASTSESLRCLCFLDAIY
jgi:hypothetical protein